MPVRYMGTKRHMAHHVRDTIVRLEPAGKVIDLFSGMGSVAESFQDLLPIVTNDTLTFTAAIARARFLSETRRSKAATVIDRLQPHVEQQRWRLARQYADALAAERDARTGSREDLSRYFRKASHVANSAHRRRAAVVASESADQDHYQMATLYFSAGYLSLQQAIDLDAIRFAIDSNPTAGERDWLLASWISAMSKIVNAPGHTAQFMSPNSNSSYLRVLKSWERDAIVEFAACLDEVTQVGSSAWRASNEVRVADALDLVNSGELENIGAVYADPPYTKDQYSRFYHLYESLYRYDFPDARGAGRTRSDRATTGFARKSAVGAAFHSLCRGVARMDVPLVLSYPSSGLLEQAGTSTHSLLSQYFAEVEVLEFDARHSTMGGSTGSSKKATTERLYVCRSPSCQVVNPP